MGKDMLKKIMAEKGVTVKVLAKKSGILKLLLYLRLWGVVEFTLDEIRRVAKVLELTEPEVAQIFFEKKFPKGNK